MSNKINLIIGNHYQLSLIGKLYNSRKKILKRKVGKEMYLSNKNKNNFEENKNNKKKIEQDSNFVTFQITMNSVDN